MLPAAWRAVRLEPWNIAARLALGLALEARWRWDLAHETYLDLDHTLASYGLSTGKDPQNIAATTIPTIPTTSTTSTTSIIPVRDYAPSTVIVDPVTGRDDHLAWRRATRRNLARVLVHLGRPGEALSILEEKWNPVEDDDYDDDLVTVGWRAAAALGVGQVEAAITYARLVVEATVEREEGAPSSTTHTHTHTIGIGCDDHDRRRY